MPAPSTPRKRARTALPRTTPERRIAAIALLLGTGLTLLAGLGFGNGHMNAAEISVVVICPIVALGLLFGRLRAES